ncbi:MAG: MCE family protein, partial [Bacteroidota bacterium]|nr:MCE family protein [Bacteroidota bacterium]
ATAQATILTENLTKTSEQLNKTDNMAGMLLNDENFANDFRITMKNLQTATAELNQTLEALQRSFLLRKQIDKMEE